MTSDNCRVEQVGYFLTDATSEGTGFQVIPKSHKFNLLNPDGSSALIEPNAGAPTTADAISIQVKAGDAVFFDRRVWHNGSAQPYLPDGMRKVLFYGYGARWLRPRECVVRAPGLHNFTSSRDFCIHLHQSYAYLFRTIDLLNMHLLAAT